jgi:2,3-bisphosphoglycerate-dependent phosphoglycerate mutase
LSESLKDVTKRTSQFWDEVIVPQIRAHKRILIVGHENNLRSIIKRLDGISDDDIVHVELPRAVPLLYEIDSQTLKPVKQDGHEDYLSGRYLGDKEQLAKIAERDYRQVYDLKITETLETVSATVRALSCF